MGIDLRKRNRRGILLVGGILLFLLLATWLTNRFELDLRLQQRYYTPQSEWYLKNLPPWPLLNRHGTVPGRILVCVAIFGLGRSFFCALDRIHRRHFLLVILTALLGAGLLINGVLKPLWGRPRPKEVMAFNGVKPYHAVFQPSGPGNGYSFPCGHSSMGYLFICLWVFRKKLPIIGYGGVVAGVVYGTTVALARMVEGAHFFSDSVWSLGLMTMVCISLHHWGIPAMERYINWDSVFSHLKKRLP